MSRTRNLLVILLAALLGCLQPLPPVADPDAPPPAPLSDVERADLLLSATVFVGVIGGHGSGFAVDEQTIFTARHVAENGAIEVLTHAGESCTIGDTYLSRDDDIALIMVTGCKLAPLPLRCRPLQIGESIWIAGHPRMFGWAITQGIVSGFYPDMNRTATDAVGLPGMSGGPTIDAAGDLVGIAVSIVADPVGRTWGGQTYFVPIGLDPHLEPWRPRDDQYCTP
jgi:S1-C subfamily serine protease